MHVSLHRKQETQQKGFTWFLQRGWCEEEKEMAFRNPNPIQSQKAPASIIKSWVFVWNWRVQCCWDYKFKENLKKKSSDLDHTDWEDGEEGIRFQNRKTLKSRYVKRPIQIEKWTIDFDFISVFFFFPFCLIHLFIIISLLLWQSLRSKSKVCLKSIIIRCGLNTRFWLFPNGGSNVAISFCLAKV